MWIWPRLNHLTVILFWLHNHSWCSTFIIFSALFAPARAKMVHGCMGQVPLELSGLGLMFLPKAITVALQHSKYCMKIIEKWYWGSIEVSRNRLLDQKKQKKKHCSKTKKSERSARGSSGTCDSVHLLHKVAQLNGLKSWIHQARPKRYRSIEACPFK